MSSILDRFREKPVERRDTPQMELSEPPREFIPARRRRLTEAAMQAAEYVNSLEGEIESLRAHIASLEAQLEVCRETSSALSVEAASLRNTNERLVRENTEIFTRLKVGAKLIMDLARELEEDHANDPQAKAEAAIRSAVAEVPQHDAPGPEGRTPPQEDRHVRD